MKKKKVDSKNVPELKMEVNEEQLISETVEKAKNFLTEEFFDAKVKKDLEKIALNVTVNDDGENINLKVSSRLSKRYDSLLTKMLAIMATDDAFVDRNVSEYSVPKTMRDTNYIKVFLETEFKK
jgi:hypothetical protein